MSNLSGHDIHPLNDIGGCGAERAAQLRVWRDSPPYNAARSLCLGLVMQFIA